MNATQAIDRRNPDLVRQLADAIAKTATKPWKIMEICAWSNPCYPALWARPAFASRNRIGSWAWLSGLCNRPGSD